MARVKRLCSSLCSSPPVSMETDPDLHLSLDLFWRQRSQQGTTGEVSVTEREMWGEKTTENGVCHQRLERPSRLSLHHLRELQSDESSWCPEAERGSQSYQQPQWLHYTLSGSLAGSKVPNHLGVMLEKHTLCNLLTLPQIKAHNTAKRGCNCDLFLLSVNLFIIFLSEQFSIFSVKCQKSAKDTHLK